ncbi:NADH dehydrogenase 1 alpha subcomplex subunit 2 [Gorgonomyces haynaldii]|nr:NADH dehydrogenase 1 alpha subcomplex subunit 2 [Gorgonomyces haynaldii]
MLGNLRELRVFLCQTSPHSLGARQFIVKNYEAIKKQNPRFPFLIRESQGIEAVAYGRFKQGKEESLSLEGLSEQQVQDAITKLAKMH